MIEKARGKKECARPHPKTTFTHFAPVFQIAPADALGQLGSKLAAQSVAFNERLWGPEYRQKGVTNGAWAKHWGCLLCR